MKRSLKLVFSLLLLISLLSCTAFAAAAPTDIAGHWAEEGITDFVTKGFINGYPDGTFKPDNQITRAEFIKMVNAAYGFTAKVEITYSDVITGDWYYDEIAKAKAAGYISGYEDGTMRPNGPISRQEAATIFLKLKALTADTAAADIFADKAHIAAWAKGAVGATVKAGFMKGYPENTFMPNRYLTRAEAVTVVRASLTVALADPTVPLAAPVVPAATGGGGGGGGGNNNPPAQIETAMVKAVVDGSEINASGYTGGDTATIVMPTDGALTKIIIGETDGVTLTVANVTATNGFNFTKEGIVLPLAADHSVSVSAIFGGNNSINISSLKALVHNSNTITITGQLTHATLPARNVALIFDISGSDCKYRNTYFEATTTGGSTDVNVRILKPATKISTIGLQNMLAAVSSSANIYPASADVHGTLCGGIIDIVLTGDPAAKLKIQQQISAACKFDDINQWENVVLGELATFTDELNMTLHDIGGKEYKVNFTN